MTKPLGDQFHVRAHVDVLNRERVSKAMRAKRMREWFLLLRPFGQSVDPHAQRGYPCHSG
jgi:hypothetical protein